MFEQYNNAFTEEQNVGIYQEIPLGTYVVSVDGMELTTSKKGYPMTVTNFTVLEGEHERRSVTVFQTVHTGFGLHKAKDLIRSMKLEDAPDFGTNFDEFSAALDGFSKLAKGRVYELEITQKGEFRNYAILSELEAV